MRWLAVLVVLVCATAHADDDQPGQVTKPPKLSHFVQADRPKGSEDKTATVVLAIDIGADGKVTDVRVTTSGGADFDAAAVVAAKQFVFEPAEIDGQPGPVTITYSYKFTVEEKIVSL